MFNQGFNPKPQVAKNPIRSAMPNKGPMMAAGRPAPEVPMFQPQTRSTPSPMGTAPMGRPQGMNMPQKAQGMPALGKPAISPMLGKKPV